MKCQVTDRRENCVDCKYWTVIDPGCILKLVANTSKFGDDEIAYYKGMHVNQVIAAKRKADIRIKKLLVLDQYINSIDLVQRDHPIELDDVVRRWMDSWPMNTGMWPACDKILHYLVDVERFDKFCKRYKLNFRLPDVIGMSREDFDTCLTFMGK